MKTYKNMTEEQLLADAKSVAAEIGKTLGIEFDLFDYGYEGSDLDLMIFPAGEFCAKYDVNNIVHKTSEELAHPSDESQPWAMVHNGTLAFGIEELALMVDNNMITWGELDESTSTIAFHTPEFWAELAANGVDIPGILQIMQGNEGVVY